MNRFPRCSGILCHVTSLPGRCGVGDLGDGAYRFVDWLEQAGQTLWQVLPLGPPGFGESPYQCYSAFAGNPLLISPQKLAEEGWLAHKEVEEAPEFSTTKVDFDKVRPYREMLLNKAYEKFRKIATPQQKNDLAAFRKEAAWWLDDYALFAALKQANEGKAWHQWDKDLVQRKPAAIKAVTKALEIGIEREAFIQYQFHWQWRALKTYARMRGVRLMGDVPIFVAHDSADVWAHQDLFYLDAQGEPLVIAGVPPDYFSETGQRWGNPLYRWDVLKKQKYRWWVDRLRHALTQMEMIRLDHFRGFEAYWEIPGKAPTAAGGRWVPGPGETFFKALLKEMGDLPLVAEDLGLITPGVEALREQFNFPGMRILQFAFGEDPKGMDYRPHNYVHNSVVYTGTHDNDTTVGWFRSEAGVGTTRTAAQVAAEQKFVLRYVGTDGSEIHWDMIRLALSSVADTAIIPMQDVLGLGSEGRMNLPGSAIGNWSWRFHGKDLTAASAAKLANWAELYDRIPGRPPLTALSAMTAGDLKHAQR